MISEHRAKESLAIIKAGLKQEPNNMEFRVAETTLKFVLGYSIVEDIDYFEVKKSESKGEIAK
jgi:hypothetical protein